MWIINKKIRFSQLIFIVGLFFSIILSFTYHNATILLEKQENNDDYIQVDHDRKLKYSDYWPNLSPIIINESDVGVSDWATISSGNDWCSGSGISNDPYVIENVCINGSGSESCIKIIDSNANFTIKNCTLFNSGYGSYPYEAGIHLYNTSNGKLVDNNCSYNVGNGITLFKDCNNNNISGNIVNNNNINSNSDGGIYLYQSDNNTISNNTVNSNKYGIKLGSSHNNTIRYNSVNRNNMDGVHIYNCDDNTINNNNVKNNGYAGIYISKGSNNSIFQNIMSGCGIGVGGELDDLLSLEINSSNLINGKPLFYCTNTNSLGVNNFIDVGQVILINCNDSIISDLEFSNCSSGISLHFCYNNTILNNTVNDNHYSIRLINSDNNTVSNNTANNNECSISLSGSDNNTISGNKIKNVYQGISISGVNNKFQGNNISEIELDGIACIDSDNNTFLGNHISNSNRSGIAFYVPPMSSYLYNSLSGNQFQNCGIYLFSESINYLSTNSIDETNLINGKPVYYYISENGLGVNNFSDAGQVILINCSDSLVSSLNISFGTFGINLYYGTNNMLLNNTVNDNLMNGINIAGSDNNRVLNNTSNRNGDYGIYIYSSENTTISDNTVKDNGYDGMRLSGCYNSTITDINAIRNGNNGIDLYDCDNSTVSNNTAYSNEDSGVYLQNMDYVDVTANIMNYNGLYGIYLRDSSHDIVSGNIINGNDAGTILESGTSSDNTFSWNVYDENIDPFIIDDDGGGDFTWAEASAQLAWCTGSGTKYNPYTLELITINGQNTDDCIEIRDSTAHFIVTNCTVYNSSGGGNAGIKFYNTFNGQLLYNNCSYNGYRGIYLQNSDNNTLLENTVNNNNNGGIVLYNSANNTLSGNTANNNIYFGIIISISNYTMLSGSTANNNGNHGIFLSNGNNNTLSGNIANNNDNYGIYLEKSDNNTLSGNTANNNTYYGIYLYKSNYTTLSGNTANNSTYYGIQLFRSNDNILSGNTANNNDNFGIFLSLSNYNTLSGNSANNNTFYGIQLSLSNDNILSGNTANNNSGSGILLSLSNYTTLSGNIANNNTLYGIQLSRSNDNILSGTIVTNNEYGFYLSKSNYTTLSGNTANNNGYGIYIVYSTNNTLSGSTASNNTNYGIYLSYCTYTTILNNNESIDYNQYGIYLDNSHYNNIMGNSINNNYRGIYLISSNYNMITLNSLINNDIGIEETLDCEGNIIVDNYIQDKPRGPGPFGLNLVTILIIIGAIIGVIGSLVGVASVRKKRRSRSDYHAIAQETIVSEIPKTVEDIKEKTSKVSQVLEFMMNVGEAITKGDLVKALDFTLDEADEYLKTLDSTIRYKKSEIDEIKARAEEALKQFTQPTLYDLVVTLGFDHVTAMKVGRYLTKTGVISKFGKIQAKVTSVQPEPIAAPLERIKLEIRRGGDWGVEGDQSIFKYKLKVHNSSEVILTNIRIHLTSIPRSLEVDSELYKIEHLRPHSYESPVFKLKARESCVGDVIEGVISYVDPFGKQHMETIEPFRIEYVCNLLTPKQVTEREFRQNIVSMDKKEIIIDSDLAPDDLEKELASILESNNFFLLDKVPEPVESEVREFKGYAEGKYDKEDVALSVVMQQMPDQSTNLVIKAMSEREEKLIDLLRDINVKCDDIKSCNELILEYSMKIEQVIDQIDNLEDFLIRHLGKDFEQIKHVWSNYKKGVIGKKGLIAEGAKILGKRFLKLFLGRIS